MTNRRKARILTMQMLYQIDTAKSNPDDILTDFKKEAKYKQEIIDFVALLFPGTIEHLEEIDKAIISLSTNWDISRMAFVDRNILRLAIFEILYVIDVPKSVSINEALEIAKKYSTEESSKFINGILDKVQKR
ncbi:transcription antitermination factor NusB [Candidatus Poribacteria bacterium]|nr:transcription antitermination factor NusB [Candidatus Poribacteria bacterium]